MYLKNKFLNLAACLGIGISSAAFAGGEAVEIVEEVAKPIYPFYLKLGVGGSFSRDANLKVDTRSWDPSPDGYNANLGDTAFYEVGFGYVFSPLWNIEVAGTARPSFEYEKFQRAVANNTNIGALGDKTRKFKLSNQSLMFNLVLDTLGLSTDQWVYDFGNNRQLRPVFAAGIGVAYNKVYDFHSVTQNVVQSGPPVVVNVASIMNENRHSDFAWQLLAGLRLTCHERVTVDLNYRYFNGGTFKSNDYTIDLPVGAGTNQPISSPPWEGKLKANEVVVSANIALL
jgi:opacity protein-like surface antigen